MCNRYESRTGNVDVVSLFILFLHTAPDGKPTLFMSFLCLYCFVHIELGSETKKFSFELIVALFGHPRTPADAHEHARMPADMREFFLARDTVERCTSGYGG